MSQCRDLPLGDLTIGDLAVGDLTIGDRSSTIEARRSKLDDRRSTIEDRRSKIDERRANERRANERRANERRANERTSPSPMSSRGMNEPSRRLLGERLLVHALQMSNTPVTRYSMVAIFHGCTVLHLVVDVIAFHCLSLSLPSRRPAGRRVRALPLAPRQPAWPIYLAWKFSTLGNLPF